METQRWQACFGEDAIAPIRDTSEEAFRDLPERSKAAPGIYKLDGMPTYECLDPWRLRPIRSREYYSFLQPL